MKNEKKTKMQKEKEKSSLPSTILTVTTSFMYK